MDKTNNKTAFFDSGSEDGIGWSVDWKNGWEITCTKDEHTQTVNIGGHEPIFGVDVLDAQLIDETLNIMITNFKNGNYNTEVRKYEKSMLQENKTQDSDPIVAEAEKELTEILSKQIRDEIDKALFDEKMNEKSCFNCINAFQFSNGMCRCFIEPSDSNTHYDNYCCAHHDFVNEEGLQSRLDWKKRQEREKNNLEK